jgi:hypothetical protein
MASQNLTADLQQILKANTFVSSDLAFPVQAILPPVGDGTGLTTDNNVLFVIAARNTGGIELLDERGRRVWYVRPRTAVTLRSTDETVGNAPRWVPETPALQEALKITDFAGTNLVAALAASASTFNAAYSEAQSDLDINLAIDTGAADIVTKTTARFVELEDKINLLARAMFVGLGASIDNSPNAGQTLALAASAMSVRQLVEDDDKLVTSARAFPTSVSLPPVVDGGAGTAVDDGYTIRLEANAAGGIYVFDSTDRYVGYVEPFTNAWVQSSLDPNRPWQFMPQDGFEVPLGRAGVAELNITRVTAPASAADSPASYTDAGWNSAVDAALDTVLAGVDTDCDTAFDEADAFLNSLLLTLESLDLMAES